VHEALVVLRAVKLAGVPGVLAMTSDTALRWVRALTLPSVLFTSAVASHVAGDGATPTPSVLLPLFVLTVVAAAPFAWATIRPAWAVALLVAGQGLLHVALQILGRTAVPATTAMSDVAIGAPAVSSTSCHLMGHSAAGSHGFAMSLMSGGHLVMLFTHLAAAVGVGVWLAAGDRTFGAVLILTARQVQDAWRTVTRVTHGAVSIVSYPRFQLRWDLRCAAVSVWAAGAVSRRGPPLCCVA
jgi:hypothetical protein